MLTADMRRIIEEQRLGFVATAAADGTPNVSPKGTFVRTISPPIEGMLVRGKQGLDVGDRVDVQLSHVDVDRGFIDFGR